MELNYKELYLFPSYKIIVFEGTHTKYSVSKTGWVCYSQTGAAPSMVETNFQNKKINTRNHQMLGRLSELNDSKCKKVFEEARWKESTFPDFTNGGRVESQLASIKSYLQAEGWTADESKTWIIIPKSSKKLSGGNIPVSFNICTPEFNYKSQNVVLPVYMNEITETTKEVLFNVEIPDFLYDFMMLHPDLELRPTSKVITTNSFAYLHTALETLSSQATSLREIDEELKKAEKFIFVAFNSKQHDVRDSWQFGYKGNRTDIFYNYFIGYKIKRNSLSTAKSVFVDKVYEQGKGFVKVTGRLVGIGDATGYKQIPWTEKREEFFHNIEGEFTKVSDNLNKFLGDMTEEKVDILVERNEGMLKLNQ